MDKPEFNRGTLLFNGDNSHDPEMESLICQLCGIDTAWRVVSVSVARKQVSERTPVGAYVDIQCVNVVTGAPAYCHFNVEPRRQRTRGKHKAGQLYKNTRQFWLTDNHALARLMHVCGITPINGMADGWQYIGRLKNRVFIAPQPTKGKQREKLSNVLVHPLSMSFFSEPFSPIRATDKPQILTDKPPISDRLATDKRPITATDKKTPETVTPQGFQSVTTTERIQRSNTVHSKQYTDVSGTDDYDWWSEFKAHVIPAVSPAELTRDDLKFLARLLPVSWKRRTAVLMEYRERWQAGMNSEPVEHCKQNAGRYAANTWLRTRGEAQ